MQRLGIGLIVVSGLIACGKSEDNNSSGTTITPGNGKLSASDLAKPIALGEMSKFDVEMYLLVHSSDFLATEAEVAEEPETEESDPDCIGDIMDQLTVKAEGDTVILDYGVDLTSCFQSAWQTETSGATVELSHALASMYIRQTCVGMDLSSLNGKKLSEMEDPGCDNSLIMANSKSDVAGVLSAEGQTLDLTSISISSTSTENNEPCTITKTGNTLSQADGCVTIQISTSADSSENEYVKYAGKSLTWVESTANTWYSSGSYDLELNDWTGSLTFGPDATPAYTMSRGTETATGTLTLPVGLHAKKAWKRALLRNMQLK
ncbi:hypothetical protein [Oligoflexus tunisiensis]|uniref:hypothetical protein n=1 Tax=Oligoflexus tunisiensis TaxID=708132 RepID=UPI00114D0DCE|nr:hypothetical protein [Oligoflexus tunisiensis]